MDEVSRREARVLRTSQAACRLLFLAGVGLWGLAGCFYLPTPEQPVDNSKDYRDFVGDVRSTKAIRPGFATRATVMCAARPAAFMSGDGGDIGYKYETMHGTWVQPLVSGQARPPGECTECDSISMIETCLQAGRRCIPITAFFLVGPRISSSRTRSDSSMNMAPN